MATDTDVLIIGAGMSGVGLAIQIVRKFGIRSFELVEKTEAIGGTWHVNSYPGCGCDVGLPSVLPLKYLDITIRTGPFPLLFLLLCSKIRLVPEVCYAARDTKVL